MTITFRVEDGHDCIAVPSATITPAQLTTLRACLADQSDRMQLALTIADYGDPAGDSFGFEVRVCPLALATVAACLDHDPAGIMVLEEAQFRGRRVRIWKAERSHDIGLGLSCNPDAAPELEVSSNNGIAILEMLGLAPDSVGSITIEELRQRLSDPRIHRRAHAEPGLTRYIPTLLEMACVRSPSEELSMAWA